MKTHSPSFLTALLLVATMVVLTDGCNKSNSLAPFQPEVLSATDNFQMQATGVTHVSTTVTYAWQNTGMRAIINHSTATTGGASALMLKDGTGTVVYTKPLAASLNDSTSAGNSGTWTVVLTLNDFSGTINFRAQKL